MKQVLKKNRLALKVLCLALLGVWTALVLRGKTEPLNGDLEVAQPSVQQPAQQSEQQPISPSEKVMPTHAENAPPEMSVPPADQTQAPIKNETSQPTETSQATAPAASAMPLAPSSTEAALPPSVEPHDARKQPSTTLPVPRKIKIEKTKMARNEKTVKTWNRSDEMIDEELASDEEGILEGRRAAFQRSFDSEAY